MSLIKVNNVSVEFDNQIALRDVSLEINEGEIVTVIGPNGAGKSSLVRLMVGAIGANSGHVEKSTGLKIGYVPQKLYIDAFMPLTVARFLKLQQNGQANDAIERTQIGAVLNKQMSQLSGGELKRVLLAYALAGNPQLLILDEPTAWLDQPAIIAFYALIEKLRADLGIAILLVSHDLNVVMRASNRVICLNTHICCQGTPSVVSASSEFQALFGLGLAPVAIYEHHHEENCQHEGHHHD